jgi:hypothetical protein
VPTPAGTGIGAGTGTGAGETAAGLVPDTLAGVRPAAAASVGGNRRRNITIAGVAGAVVGALIGLVALVAFRPDESRSPADPLAVQFTETASAGAGGENTGPTATATATATANPSGTASAGSTPSGTARPTTSGSPKPTATRTGTAPSNPYTAAQVCGSGYQVIDSAELTGPDRTSRGKVYLLYNAGNGYNCTVALKATSLDTATAAAAYLEVQGQTRTANSGSFQYYAGPVRAKAAGACVKWGGSAGGASYNSPFEHCD